MLIGEIPGDREDRAGAPFVGPAGHLLDAALEDAGLERAKIYTTNVVKHFKWEARGKRRIHQKPNAKEIAACKPWLEAELAAVKPRAIGLLGAVAAQSLFGAGFKVTRERGRVFESERGPVTMATVHPASVLRAGSAESRQRAKQDFRADIATLAAALDKRVD
jgi:DNA polymerase